MSTISLSKNISTTHKAVSQSTQPAETPCTGELILIRGLPGSGKSRMGNILSLIGFEHYEADQYFVKNGSYHYEANKVREAHLWCQAKVRTALANSKRVVVCNTFTRISEMEPYLGLTPTVRILEAKGKWKNIHGVSAERIKQMAERWEKLPSSLQHLAR
ncbi:hypothetical protein ACFQPC_00260 [Herminiimonas glaciei]|uniref:AAA domain-containing protein n=1 Tax=Herminiimonas glaciei TaxID=523788 RepID=A0ABW2I645_9BURK